MGEANGFAPSPVSRTHSLWLYIISISIVSPKGSIAKSYAEMTSGPVLASDFIDHSVSTIWPFNVAEKLQDTRIYSFRFNPFALSNQKNCHS